MSIYSREEIVAYILDHCKIVLGVNEQTRNGSEDPQSQDADSIKSKAASIPVRLGRLSDDQLWRLFKRVLRIQWIYAENGADFRHWARMAGWTLEEATALLLGKDPNLIDDEFLEEPISGPYWELQQLIHRAQTMQVLPAEMQPLEVLNWADQYKVRYPEALKAAIIQYARPAAGAGLEELRKKIDQQSNLIAKLTSDRDDLLAKNEAIRREMTLNPKIRQSLLEMVLGMASAYHGYIPKEVRSNAPQDVKDELDRVGISVDVDTIRARLREAADEFGDLINIDRDNT